MKFICVKKIIWETSVEVAECLCLCNRCEAMPQQYLEGRTRRLFAKTTTILGCHSFFSSVFYFYFQAKRSDHLSFSILRTVARVCHINMHVLCLQSLTEKLVIKIKGDWLWWKCFWTRDSERPYTEWENRFADTRLLVGLPFLAPASTCILSLAETLFKMYNLPRTSICCNPLKKNKTKQDKTLPGDLLSLGSNTPLSK